MNKSIATCQCVNGLYDSRLRPIFHPTKILVQDTIVLCKDCRHHIFWQNGNLNGNNVHVIEPIVEPDITVLQYLRR